MTSLSPQDLHSAVCNPIVGVVDLQVLPFELSDFHADSHWEKCSLHTETCGLLLKFKICHFRIHRDLRLAKGLSEQNNFCIPRAELNDILSLLYKVFLNCLINQDQFSGANFLVKLAFNSTGRQFPFDNRTSHLTSPSQRHVFSSFWFDWLISNKCNADFLKMQRHCRSRCVRQCSMHPTRRYAYQTS